MQRSLHSHLLCIEASFLLLFYILRCCCCCLLIAAYVFVLLQLRYHPKIRERSERRRLHLLRCLLLTENKNSKGWAAAGAAAV